MHLCRRKVAFFRGCERCSLGKQGSVLHWEECTSIQLKWFINNGTRSQKSIARFHLRIRKYVREHYTFESTKMAAMDPVIVWGPHEAAMRAPFLEFPRDQ